MTKAQLLRSKILDLVVDYTREEWPEKPFQPGVDPVPYAGRVFDDVEVLRLVGASLDFWLTAGPETREFERLLAGYVGVKHASFCNSGSSANLLAVSALTAQEHGTTGLKPGDEVITVAAGFPTTVNPIVQCGAVPVFCDVDPATLNVDVSQFAGALTRKTKAVVLAHTLGNPFDLDAVTTFCTEHDLWLVEDNCDALASLYRGKRTGSFGDLATQSFYPAHHITTGEGGAVLTSTPGLKLLVESYRDWGRACWCEPGKDNTCGKRFSGQHGSLPTGYDHKFTYARLGYNLKATDLQAAVGVAQMDKLDGFVAARRLHWQFYRDRLEAWSHWLRFQEPTPGSEPSWFGFAITVDERAPFTRRDLVAHLDRAKIATRVLFGGDLTRQPGYSDVRYRQVGTLPVTTQILDRTFWIGVYPGLTPDMLAYVGETIEGFCRSF